MNRRLKQIMYGSMYVAVWVIVGYGIYLATLKPPPSCFDNVRNGNETGVDCGGGCLSCAIKNLQPIRVMPAKVLESEEGATAVLEFRNPNADFGASQFGYKALFFGTGPEPLYTEETETLIYAGEVQYKVLVNLPFKATDVSFVSATGTTTTWKATADLSQPRMQLSEIRLDTSGGRGMITGVIRNENAYAVQTVTLNGLVSDTQGNLVAASKTIVRDLDPTEERGFQIVVPIPQSAAAATLAAPKVTVEARR